MNKRGGKRLCGLMLMLAVVLTGCWDYTDLEDAAVVAGLAMERGMQGGYRITAEIADPKEEDPGSYTVQAEGRTPAEALSRIGDKLERTVYWASMQAVILTPDVAGDGLSALLDMADRGTAFRPTVRVAVSKEAAALLVGDGMRSDGLSRLLSKREDAALYRIATALSGPGESAVLPVLQPDSGKFVQVGAAVVRKDGLCGTLTESEAWILSLLQNDAQDGSLTISGSDMTAPATLELRKSETRILPALTNEKLQISVSIRASAVIAQGGIESNSALESLGAEALADRAERLISKLQHEVNADVLGFGEAVRSALPKRWAAEEEGWSQKGFQSAAVQVNTQMMVEDGGIYKGAPGGEI